MGAVMVREKIPDIAPAKAFRKSFRGMLVAVESFDGDGERSTSELVARINPERSIVGSGAVACSLDNENCLEVERNGHTHVDLMPTLSFFHSGLGRFMMPSLV